DARSIELVHSRNHGRGIKWGEHNRVRLVADDFVDEAKLLGLMLAPCGVFPRLRAGRSRSNLASDAHSAKDRICGIACERGNRFSARRRVGMRGRKHNQGKARNVPDHPVLSLAITFHRSLRPAWFKSRFGLRAIAGRHQGCAERSPSSVPRLARSCARGSVRAARSWLRWRETRLRIL